MGMAADELHRISPRSLFNKLYGYRRAEQAEWDRTRMKCYYAFSPIDPSDPEKKRLMPMQQFMPLPWDADTNKTDGAALVKRMQDAEALWQRIDSNKNPVSSSAVEKAELNTAR